LEARFELVNDDVVRVSGWPQWVDFGPSALGTLAFSLTMVMAAESSLIEAASIPSGDLLDLIRGRPLDVD